MFTNLSYANMPYWGILPMGMTNFGGDTQVFTVPEYSGSRIGLVLNGLAQQQLASGGGGIGGMFPTFTGPGAADVQSAVQANVGMGLNTMASGIINLTLSNITAAKTRLNAMLQKEGISDEDKTKINEMLDKLKEYEDQLRDLIKNQKETSAEDAYQKAAEIETGVREILGQIGSIGKTEKADDKDKVDDDKDKVDDDKDKVDDDKDKVDDDEDKVDNDKDKVDDDEDKVDKKDKTQGATKFSSAIVNLVDQFYDATYCWGTDDNAFNAVCDSITKDNVMDVMLAWKKFHGTEKNESFMTTFMYDADRSQKIKYGKLIARALRDKAEELGIYDECREDFAAIDKEMGSWLWVNNDVAKNYDNIIRKIAEKEGKTYNTEDFKY